MTGPIQEYPIKQCSYCGEMKPISNYHKDRTADDGHVSGCKACIKIKSRIYNQQHRKENKEKAMAWSKNNPDRRKSIQSTYMARHADQVRESHRLYLLNNPDKRAATIKKYAESHKEKIREYRIKNKDHIAKKCLEHQRKHPEMVKARKAKYRARKYAAEIRDFTHQQWVELQERFNHRCAYCGKRCKGKLDQEHITPLSKGGNHTLSNIVPACSSCNSKKHTGPPISPVQPLLISIF